MNEKLLIKMHKMIQERLDAIGQSHYDDDLSELNDPVINTILEIRREIITDKVRCDHCGITLDRVDAVECIWPEYNLHWHYCKRCNNALGGK